METGGPDDGPVEAEPDRAQNAENRQFGGFGGNGVVFVDKSVGGMSQQNERNGNENIRIGDAKNRQFGRFGGNGGGGMAQGNGIGDAKNGQNANIGQFGGWGSGIQWGNRAQNAKIGQFGAGNANANVVQGRGGWGGFGHGWPPARHWPGPGSGRDRGTANANIVQGPGGPRGRMMYNAADASRCRCYFKGKPCSGRGKRTRQ